MLNHTHLYGGNCDRTGIKLIFSGIWLIEIWSYLVLVAVICMVIFLSGDVWVSRLSSYDAPMMTSTLVRVMVCGRISSKM